MVLEQRILIEDKTYTVIISDEPQALLAAKAAGRAVVGVEAPGGQERVLWDSSVPFVVPGFEYATEELAELVLRRHLGLPWLIDITERLLVREFVQRDWMYIPEEEGAEREAVFRSEHTMEEYIKNQYMFYEYGTWALTARESGELVGMAGVSNPRLPRVMEEYLDGMDKSRETEISRGDGELKRPLAWLELGYHIFRPYRRRGYGSEALRSIRDYAHEVLEARLCAVIEGKNKASRCLAEHLGLSLVMETDSESSEGLLLYAETRR